jgi:putative methylase
VGSDLSLKNMKSERKWTKKRLAIELSKLKNFDEVSVKLEQYATPSEIAAAWVWNAMLKDDIAGKVIVDAACGPGILGCGALLMGADKVIFVDISLEALDLAKENVKMLAEEYEIGESEFIRADIADFTLPEGTSRVDTVLQNPPFGTKIRHHDRTFLEKAFVVGNVIYSMHKENTWAFVKAIVQDNGFEVTDRWTYDFRIGNILPWHKKPAVVVKTTVWRLVKR